MAEQKKPGPIKRLKNWWDGLTFNQQLGITIGVWTLDGFIFGSEIMAAHKNKQIQRETKIAHAKGYICGQMDAYKEMAKNPYGMMNAGMKKLEQQGKATKF